MTPREAGAGMAAKWLPSILSVLVTGGGILWSGAQVRADITYLRRDVDRLAGIVERLPTSETTQRTERELEKLEARIAAVELRRDRANP